MVVKNLKDTIDELKHEKTKLNNEIFAYKIDKLASKDNIVLVEKDLASNETKNLCEKLKLKAKKIAGVVSENINSYSFMLLSDNVNLQTLASVLREKFNAKCGGKANAISGQFEGNVDEIKHFIENYEE